jgi:hypothetical protein
MPRRASASHEKRTIISINQVVVFSKTKHAMQEVYAALHPHWKEQNAKGRQPNLKDGDFRDPINKDLAGLWKNRLTDVEY